MEPSSQDESQGSKRPKPRGRVTIRYEWCKKCRICIVFCPTGVFTSDEFGAPIISHPEKCINCGLCVLRCPDFAIKLEALDEGKGSETRKQQGEKDSGVDQPKEIN
ncbi:MAG: hypothetical protein A3G33_05955 [Omnitrophica bacterium RIFCSPLOWO2_12_FULL_44_17]|uniref:4Fe-4S ferredoxin-type domain-containing protein n=1 Tax=Candidatus Danuiimicrobium aquiferis TaxID=1801832 RepID=A0A1G1L2E4_9BACT|nr:MAG: hypothetical protein A3B72_06185 [Omnitrophica bacterium RIFCSPHIGHO2_02_FULL_45_28]OGW89471.1 MAG: hypothetical protein A3E74_08500 [Omnitrophica bacterium RIFCSPHIGHO2_12_FULL_44_12]OGW99332.1 MAG: hypothetical protein A3G33_05955 [Omnitrophica bacterium RIFCSPLOWO2_12_FULL_44_17]